MILELCEDRLLASLALIFLATTHMTFAGLENFYINENFVTPRLAANGLILWALALLLEQKTWKSLRLIVLALALHPLMACSGLMVYLAYYCRPGVSRSGTLSFSGLAFLTRRFSALFRFFGKPSSGPHGWGWRDAVQRANPYNFPPNGLPKIGGTFWERRGIVLAACTGPLRSSKQQRLIACVAAVAVAGIAINVSELPTLLCLADSRSGLSLALVAPISANSARRSADFQLVATRHAAHADRRRCACRLFGKHRW